MWISFLWYKVAHTGIFAACVPIPKRWGIIKLIHLSQCFLHGFDNPNHAGQAVIPHNVEHGGDILMGDFELIESRPFGIFLMDQL
ncbi:MAG: hypothetical protein PVH87_25970 [Desulfobacteraceae bacterium]|jgi:hypothetical protein